MIRGHLTPAKKGTLGPALTDVLVTKVDTSRRRRLDPYRPYIEYLLERFPRLSNVKLARKISAKFGEMPVSQRSLRRYVRSLKEAGVFAQPRYYEPVLDNFPVPHDCAPAE